jgi:hypothetical protein
VNTSSRLLESLKEAGRSGKHENDRSDNLSSEEPSSLRTANLVWNEAKSRLI